MERHRILLLAACHMSFFVTGLVAQEPKPAAKKNLIVNGSFEEGPDPGQFMWFNEGDKTLPGWTVSRGQISYIGLHWPAAHGKRSLDMHGGPGFGGIKQTFATTKGQRYRVQFALAANPLGTVTEKKLGVEAAGKKGVFVFDSEGKTVTDMGWSTQVWEFVATDNQTTIEFYTLMTEDPDCGAALDDISVVALDP
jgi:choice-of-anchor C domain-containing protein